MYQAAVTDYKSPKILAGTVITFLVLSMLSSLGSAFVVVTNGSEALALPQDINSFTASQLTLNATTFGEKLLFVIAGLFFIIWLCRLWHNLASFRLNGFETRLWHCIWSFFIPIWNLFKPLIVVEEIWQASSPATTSPTQWQFLPKSKLISCWWWLYVGGSFIDMFVRFARKGMTVTTLHGHGHMMYFYFASWAASFASMVACIMLVRALTAMQDQKHEKLMRKAQEEQPA
ncbi:MAG TPA: DUF4328 domain-containing protein [Chroococcales cyanobacterium]